MVSDSKPRPRYSSSTRQLIARSLILVLFGYLPCAIAKYAAIIIDTESGRVLHEENADTLNYPASLTKMMTLYLVFSALENKEITLDTRWTVSAAAAAQPPTKLGLRRGQTITARNCILSLVTQSANDMAVVVAEGLAGSEYRFAQMMTEKSRDLKMMHTTFKNASGLPDRRQTTTARDMTRLALALMRDFPQYYGFFSTRSFKFGNRVYRNHNALLNAYHGTDGIKTGYIRASGYNLAASSVRNGRRLIGVVMGGRTSFGRNQQMISLLDRGFAKLAKEGPWEIQKLSESVPLMASIAKDQPAMEPVLTETSIAIPRQQVERQINPRWGIQVGAFSNFTPAQSAATQAKVHAPQLLKASRTVISPFRNHTGFIYRARLIGIAEQEARKACEILRSKQISCITVPPSNQQAAATAP